MNIYTTQQFPEWIVPYPHSIKLNSPLNLSVFDFQLKSGTPPTPGFSMGWEIREWEILGLRGDGYSITDADEIDVI